MDALARLEPVARPLTRAVDHALATLGAPPEHRVWSQLRRVGATPGDGVAWAAALDPARLYALAGSVRERAAACAAARIPVDLGWLGHAGASYAARAAALDEHLRADGDDSLAGRLRASAGYLDAVARWQQRARDGVARALAEAMTSAHAVTLRLAGAGFDRAAVTAAADVGARLLAELAAVVDDGDELRRGWAPRLSELAFHEPGAPATPSISATVELPR